MSEYSYKLSAGYCMHNGVAVLDQNGTNVSFLIENPKNEELKARLERSFESYVEYGKRNFKNQFVGDINVKYVRGNRDELKKCISGLYEKKTDATNIEEDISDEENAAAVILLDTILNEGIKQNATDIHFENNNVKFRLNGKLRNQIELEAKKFDEVIQRLKLLGNINVLENRKSQDGHFVYGKKGENRVFVRISTLPVIDKNLASKESVVLRLLDCKRVPLELYNLGFNKNQLLKITEILEQKSGLILVCGETGAGKSTTIASMLLELQRKNGDGLKIISLEDPPEYVIKGVSQVKIDEKINCSFENVLEHVFRQDPDVIMIGEIRDKKSAAAALQASMTGHLVFATLHTDKAGMSLLRLENLGLSRELVCSVLKGVLIQHLDYFGSKPALICDVCKTVENMELKVRDAWGEEQLDDLFEHCVNSDEILKKVLSALEMKHQFAEQNERNENPAGKSSKIIPMPLFNSFAKVGKKGAKGA